MVSERDIGIAFYTVEDGKVYSAKKVGKKIRILPQGLFERGYELGHDEFREFIGNAIRIRDPVGALEFIVLELRRRGILLDKISLS